jgi:hypothetical protein
VSHQTKNKRYKAIRAFRYNPIEPMKTLLPSAIRLGLYCGIVCLFIVGCGGSGSPQNPTPPPSTPLAIQSVTPATVPAGSVALTVTITGTGFTTTSQVTVNNTQVPTVYVSATQLQATVPASQLASGTQLQIAVTNGTSTITNTPVILNVDNPTPVLLGVAPSMIAVGSSGATVTLSGTGFVSTSVANLNGDARPTTFTSSTQLAVSLTASDLASIANLTITVTNPAPGGGATSGQQVSVVNPLPAITSISPASVAAGSSSTSLDIIGTNFLSTTAVSLNNAALTATFISSTELNATVPATSLAAGATVSVTLSNPAPGGGVSAPFNITVVSPQPVLTSILPSNVATGSASATITLTGSGFESNSVAQWNGSARPTTFISATSVQVILSSSDLMNSGTGKLTIANPAPGGGTTTAGTLNITSLPIPTVQGITLTTQSSTGCSTIQATLSGANFTPGATIQLNGFSLAPNFSYTLSSDEVLISLPASVIPKSGPLTFTVTNYGNPPIVSDPYTLPSTTPAVVALCSSPAPATIYASTSFSLSLSAAEVNTTAVPVVSLGALPTGVTLTSPASISIPSSGAALTFTAASSVVPGTYSIPITGQAGPLSVTGSLQLNIQTGPPPSFGFGQPVSQELGVAIGGSGQIQFDTIESGAADYNIIPTVSGLPSGTTATVSPSTFIPGQTVTVTITTASTAPVSQNVTVTLTGTPVASVPPAQVSFLLDVTAPPGSLPDNRTDFISTAGTPYAAVYDSTHNQIFSSNPSWNRVDVISNQSHKIIGSVNIRDPQGIDITPDNSTIWVATGTPQIYSIDTSTLAVTHFTLPSNLSSSSFSSVPWVGGSLLTLSDGTLLLQTNPYSSGVSVVWTPATNSFTSLTGFLGPLLRSGDHSRAYATLVNSSTCQTMMYTVASKATTTFPSSSEGCGFDAANTDGSRLVGSSNGTYGIYDGNFNLLGNLPGAAYSAGISFYGGFVFSADSTTVYQIGTASSNLPVILTYDVASMTLKGTAPAMTGNVTTPFAVDPTGLILGLQNFGIAFEDSTFFQTYSASQPGPSNSLFLSPLAGPIGGGTASSPYGGYSLIPDVWYGQNRGSASISGDIVTITSPAGDASGPVNLKFLFPDGTQIFNPQAFSYSTYPQYATLSGASPNGGIPGQIAGYGLPADASGGTMTIAGQAATITTTTTQYPPYTGEPFPSTFLDFTIPAGTPGWADLQIQTPIGTGTLPKAIFYAKSVTDYSSSDTFTDVLYDTARQQVYLSGSDHIDVFSLTSNQWLTPLKPAAIGSNSQFRGLTLTPDGSQLLAANFLDSSVGVINPDTPSQTFAIGLPGTSAGSGTCATGPFSVAALAGGQAFVSTGLPTGIGGCPYNETLYLVNLQTHSATTITPLVPLEFICQNVGSTNESSADGTLAIVSAEEGSTCLYSAISNSFISGQTAVVDYYGVAMAGDGNLASAGNAFLDASGNMVGSLARPVALFNGQTVTPYPLNNYPANSLQRPRLNAAGSLYYWAYPNYFEIFDVPTATLRLRFSLTETVQNVETPIAIDTGGRQVFLITSAGLTIVDLGSAPLSIGHLSPSTASSGTQIQIRGSGFKSGITTAIGGQPATISFTDENTLTVTVPTLSSGPQNMTLTNPDGTTYTLQGAITVQ